MFDQYDYQQYGTTTAQLRQRLSTISLPNPAT
nr:MAG TPA: hypothetical protein [Caudoviricetes sp.]